MYCNCAQSKAHSSQQFVQVTNLGRVGVGLGFTCGVRFGRGSTRVVLLVAMCTCLSFVLAIMPSIAIQGTALD